MPEGRTAAGRYSLWVRSNHSIPRLVFQRWQVKWGRQAGIGGRGELRGCLDPAQRGVVEQVAHQRLFGQSLRLLLESVRMAFSQILA